jgi:hypothetical protein
MTMHTHPAANIWWIVEVMTQRSKLLGNKIEKRPHGPSSRLDKASILPLPSVAS